MDETINLQDLDDTEFADFFAHLGDHALHDEHDLILGHIREVEPSPQNIGILLLGMAGCVSVVAGLIRQARGLDAETVVELRFGHLTDPGDALLAAAGGPIDLRSATEVDSRDVPEHVRWAAQITSFAISDDNETVMTLVDVVVRSYLDDIAAVRAGGDMGECAAMQTVLSMASCLVGFASEANPIIHDLATEPDDTSGG